MRKEVFPYPPCSNCELPGAVAGSLPSDRHARWKDWSWMSRISFNSSSARKLTPPSRSRSLFKPSSRFSTTSAGGSSSPRCDMGEFEKFGLRATELCRDHMRDFARSAPERLRLGFRCGLFLPAPRSSLRGRRGSTVRFGKTRFCRGSLVGRLFARLLCRFDLTHQSLAGGKKHVRRLGKSLYLVLASSRRSSKAAIWPRARSLRAARTGVLPRCLKPFRRASRRRGDGFAVRRSLRRRQRDLGPPPRVPSSSRAVDSTGESIGRARPRHVRTFGSASSHVPVRRITASSSAESRAAVSVWRFSAAAFFSRVIPLRAARSYAPCRASPSVAAAVGNVVARARHLLSRRWRRRARLPLR